MKVSSSAISAYKAIVVILLIIMSSPFIRKWLADRKNRRLAARAASKTGKEVA